MRVSGIVTYAKLGEKTDKKTGVVTERHSVAIQDETVGRVYLTVISAPFPEVGERVEAMITRESAFVGQNDEGKPGAVLYREGIVTERAA